MNKFTLSIAILLLLVFGLVFYWRSIQPNLQDNWHTISFDGNVNLRYNSDLYKAIIPVGETNFAEEGVMSVDFYNHDGDYDASLTVMKLDKAWNLLDNKPEYKEDYTRLLTGEINRLELSIPKKNEMNPYQITSIVKNDRLFTLSVIKSHNKANHFDLEID